MKLNEIIIIGLYILIYFQSHLHLYGFKLFDDLLTCLGIRNYHLFILGFIGRIDKLQIGKLSSLLYCLAWMNNVSDFFLVKYLALVLERLMRNGLGLTGFGFHCCCLCVAFIAITGLTDFIVFWSILQL